MIAPVIQIRMLRFAAGAVIVAALALSGWSFWQWQTQMDWGTMMNSVLFGYFFPPFDVHQQRDLLWADALPSVVLLLINAAGVAVLLLARAAHFERRALTNRPPIENTETGIPGGPRQARWPRLSAAATTPEVTRTLATAIVISCAFLMVMVTSPLGWRTLTGVSMMIEFVDVFGVLSLVNSWVVLVALLLISLSIAIFLYTNAEPSDRPKSGNPGSNEGR